MLFARRKIGGTVSNVVLNGGAIESGFFGPLIAIVADRASPAAGNQRPAVPAVVAVSNGNRQEVIPLDHLGSFLTAHSNGIVACVDAANLHWLFHEELEGQGDEQGLEALWALSADFRLHDIGLLEQRLQLTRNGVHSGQKSIGELVADSGRQFVAENWLELRDSVETIHRRIASAQADDRESAAKELAEVLFWTYKSYAITAAAAEKLARSPADSRCGPLGIGIDVQGAIALERATRNGISLTVFQADSIWRAAEKVYRDCSAILRANRRARDCFRWDGHLIARDPIGEPKVILRTLDGWLGHWHNDLVDLLGVPVIPPVSNSGKFSYVARHWGTWVYGKKEVTAYAEITAASDVLRSCQLAETGSGRITPRYAVVPAVASQGPELPFIRRLAAAPFHPSDGCSFIVIRLRGIELRSFAAVQSGAGIEQKLAATIDGGDEPIATAARQLASSRLAGRLQTAFKTQHANENLQRQFENVAEAILSSLIQGLPAKLAIELVRACSHVELDVPLGRELQKFFGREIFPEMAVLIEDPLIRCLADHVGKPPQAVAGELFAKQTPETLRSAVQKSYERTIDGGHDWERLKHLVAAQPEGDASVLEPEFKDPDQGWFLEWPVSRTGRIGGPVFAPQRLRQTCLEIADEVIKAVAFRLTMQGFTLVAVADHDLVIELAEAETAVAIEPVVQLVNAAAKPLLGRFAANCCSCEIAPRW